MRLIRCPHKQFMTMHIGASEESFQVDIASDKCELAVQNQGFCGYSSVYLNELRLRSTACHMSYPDEAARTH